MAKTRAHPFDLSDPDRIRLLREVFDGAGYSDAGVAELLGDDLPPRLGAARIPVLLRRTAGGTPLETLVRLFILGVDVPDADVRRAIEPTHPEDWVALGLLERSSDGYRGRVQIRCYRNLLVASDFGRDRGGQVQPDFVMAISPSTLALAGFTVRRPARTTLDLGCGSGFLAFLASAHSQRVVGVDRNPRAVAMGRLNSLLNGLDRVEFRK